MLISTVQVKNFRSINPHGIEMNINSISAFVGRNSSGKSSILLALDYFFNASTCELSDFWYEHTDTPIDILVTFHLEESEKNTQVLMHSKDGNTIVCKKTMKFGDNKAKCLIVGQWRYTGKDALNPYPDRKPTVSKIQSYLRDDITEELRLINGWHCDTIVDVDAYMKAVQQYWSDKFSEMPKMWNPEAIVENKEIIKLFPPYFYLPVEYTVTDEMKLTKASRFQLIYNHIPAVKTARPLPGALTHTVVLSGTVEAKELYPVIATDDLIVMRVHGRAGQSVKAGDALLSYDMETLQTELKTKKTALERVTLEGKRQATGIESAQDAETERRILRLDTDAAQAEVDRINALIANGGIITAPVDGIIIEALIKPGEVASGVVFRIAPASSGMIAKAPVSNDQWPHLRSGMQANAQRQGEMRGKGVVATISGLVPSAFGYEAVFELPASAWSVGQNLTLTHTTDTYDMRVPLGAIAESNGNKGVYRVRTRDSVLGETEYAEFVPVKVIETDAQSAAIEATLSDKDQVIVLTSKPINDGDRVRSKK